MEIVLNSSQMKQCDKTTIETFGMPSLVLMERAALGVAEEIERHLAIGYPAVTVCWEGSPGCPAAGYGHGNKKYSALIACGHGNNGGDGLAIGRLLWQKGYQVTILMPPSNGKLSEETKVQKKILGNYGIAITDEMPSQAFDVIVDALFGIGLTRDLQGIYREYIAGMNGKTGLKVAVDIPSGIHADTGAVMGAAFRADVTVTFAFAKLGLLLYPGAEYAGKVLVKDIGISRHSLPGAGLPAWDNSRHGLSGMETHPDAGLPAWDNSRHSLPGTGLPASDIIRHGLSGMETHPGAGGQPPVFSLGPEDLSMVPARKAYSNKGTFGKVLVAAGQKNMAGAAFLSGNAAYATGAGLVKIFTEEANREILQGLLPEAILATYSEGKELEEETLSGASTASNCVGKELEEETLSGASAVSNGRKKDLEEEILPEAILATYSGEKSGEGQLEKLLGEALSWATAAVVGPGLGTGETARRIVRFALKEAEIPLILDADGLNLVAKAPEWLKGAKAPVIVTPHLGELARLTGSSIPDIQQGLLQAARAFAAEYHVICVLKDARTVTALPDGRAYINTSGNHGMATGGAGDVLTGVLAGLIAQGMDLEQAAPAGVYLHGAAADRQAAELGAYGMTARDIVSGIRAVLHGRESMERR